MRRNIVVGNFQGWRLFSNTECPVAELVPARDMNKVKQDLGEFPTCSDCYNSLALPGQAPAPRPRDAAADMAHLARKAAYAAMRDAVEKGDGSHRDHVEALLRAGPLSSRVINELNAQTSHVPLAPLWKTEEEEAPEDPEEHDNVKKYRPSAPQLS